MYFLHETGSSNPLGVGRDVARVPFHPYYTLKDLYAALLVLAAFTGIVFFYPTALIEPENFFPADPLVTPKHIVPE